MKLSLFICPMFFFAAVPWIFVHAIDEIGSPMMETMTRHDMLHSSRQLTVEDVLQMSFFADVHHSKETNDPKIGSSLQDLVTAEANGLVTNEFILRHGLTVSESRNVLVDVVGDITLDLEGALYKNGYVSSSCYKHMCSLYIAIDKIFELARLPQVTRVYAPIPFQQESQWSSEIEVRNRYLQQQVPISVGNVTSQGVIAHNIDKARAKYNVNGTGILIGVIASSFDCRKGAVNDTLSGDLPPNITIVGDVNSTECASSGNVDEGRSIIQTLYDVVPGATFAFYGLGTSQVTGVFEGRVAKGIKALADAGCDIIIEAGNTAALDEPFFQHGPAAQAVDDVITRGIIYYSRSNNFNPASAWDAPSGFVPSGISPPNSTGQFHLFGNSSTGAPIISQRIGFRNGVPAADIILFQWDEPSFKSSGAPGCQSDLDVILSINGVLRATGSDANIGKEPGEGIIVVPLLSGSRNATVFYDMFIIHKSGPFPKYMKMITRTASGVNVIYEFPSNSTTIVGKANSALVTGVRSVLWQNTPAFGVSPPNDNGIILPSYGIGNAILFDRFGNRTSTPTTRNTIRFSAATNTLLHYLLEIFLPPHMQLVLLH